MKPDLEEESQHIVARYNRRQAQRIERRTLPASSVREKDRVFKRWLSASSIAAPQTLRLLEIGCGSGAQLQRMLRLGFNPENVYGCDLLVERLDQARQQLPRQVTLLHANALEIQLPESSFDVVFQSTVFSSILNNEFKSALANRMWELVRPGGGVLWYDFIYNNPRNPDVRGVRVKEVLRLFPHSSNPLIWRLTLLPPLARLVDAISPLLYDIFSLLPFLRSHILVWIPKPAGR